MALIKCPECGKEVSDKAEKCLNCSYPIKNMPRLRKCPECQNIVEEKYEVCPCCGYPFEKETALNTKKKIKKIFSNKKVLIGIVIIFVIGLVIIGNLVNKNPYEEYTAYIGKNEEELPSGFKKQEVVDGYWIAEKNLNKDEVKFSNVSGKMDFFYSEEEFEDYDAKPNEVFSMTWEPEYKLINGSTVEKEIKALEKYYGKYDKKVELDNTSDAYSYEDDDFAMTNYVWNDEDGKEIIMRVKEEGDEYESIEINIRKKQVET